MGRLYFPDQVFDANGDPMSGAKLYTYDATATTTPKATYTTNALSTAHANPIVADTAGRFADAFAETGEGFYAVLKTSADVAVAAWENVEALGESATDNITRTFTASRYKVSSGTVDGVNDGTLVEYGSLSPTNTGGYVKEGGWAGSQGTYKKIDFAAVALTGTLTTTGNATVGGNLTVSGTGSSSVGGAFNTGGKITENSKKLTDVVYTAAGSWTAASSVEITLPDDPTDCRQWVIDLFDMTQGSSAQVAVDLTISYDGSSYKTGASDYAWALVYTAGATSPSGTGDDADDSIRMDNFWGGKANHLGTGEIVVTTPASGGTTYTQVRGHLTYVSPVSTAYVEIAQFSGIGLGAYGRARKLKITVASGTFSGKYRVRPQRGMGE